MLDWMELHDFSSFAPQLNAGRLYTLFAHAKSFMFVYLLQRVLIYWQYFWILQELDKLCVCVICVNNGCKQITKGVHKDVDIWCTVYYSCCTKTLYLQNNNYTGGIKPCYLSMEVFLLVHSS